MQSLLLGSGYSSLWGVSGRTALFLINSLCPSGPSLFRAVWSVELPPGIVGGLADDVLSVTSLGSCVNCVAEDVLCARVLGTHLTFQKKNILGPLWQSLLWG